ncbi:hypothetical protein [Bradyrhizobium sp. STM 3557]
MEAVGLMTGGVGHGFNDLLLLMMIHAEVLRGPAIMKSLSRGSCCRRSGT